MHRDVLQLKRIAGAPLVAQEDQRTTMRSAKEDHGGDLSKHDNTPMESPVTARPPSQATVLVELAAKVELFHTVEHDAFATVLIDDHLETWPVKSKTFRLWLQKQYFDTHQTAVSAQGLQDALGVLESKALFDGPEERVFIRLAERNGVMFLDLCNDHWEVVVIDASGWRVTAASPVRFRRTPGMLPLPTPVPDGSIDELRRFVNLTRKQKDEWVLLIAWLLGAFRPSGPYPLLILHGEQGSGKSSCERTLRALIDPSTSPLRSSPRGVHDLMIAASNSRCLAFDNLSHLEPWLSDALCRLATGGGFSTRQLYSDGEETLFEAQRPVMINGIEELATRSDLLDRGVSLYLLAITDKSRKTETALQNAFEAARPRIIGALLTAVSAAMKNLPTVKLDRLPRMADFAAWVTAAESALGWSKGTFRKAYNRNRQAANDLSLEGSVLVPPLLDLLKDPNIPKPWKPTATDLLAALNGHIDEATRRSRWWPASARALSNALRRLAPNLRAKGVDMSFHHVGGRWIQLEYRPISSSAASKGRHGTKRTKAGSPPRTQTDVHPNENPSRNHQNTMPMDDVDAVDGPSPLYSGEDEGGVPWLRL